MHQHSGIRDNHQRGKVVDFLSERISAGSQLSVVSAYFTIYAYEALSEDPKAKTPCPIVRMAENRPAKNLLAKAKELLTTPYLEAAANYTRQAFELAIRGACEAKGIEMSYRVYPKGHKKPLESQAFLDKLKQWKASDQHKQTAWDEAVKKLETMKSVVMNPYSHPSAPNIPKQEIQQAIDAVEKFMGLSNK